MKKSWLDWIAIGLRITLGGIFAYAGVVKILDGQAFADSIHTFRLLPAELINLLAIGLPVLEVLVGGMLVAGLRSRIGTVLVMLMCLVFLIAISQAMIRGLEVNCGCFGGGKPSVAQTVWSLVRDVMLGAAAFFVFWREQKRHG